MHQILLDSSPFQIFQPIHSLWWNVFGVTLQSALSFIYSHVVGIPILDVIGPYGVAIIVLPNLNENPNHHLLFSGLPIPTVAYLVFPLLAAITTLVQSRMLQMPPSPNPTDQEAQTQQMQRTMLWISPLMIGYFALNVPAGLGLYWFVGNLVSIIQQSFVVGWDNVLPARFRRGTAGAPSVPARGMQNGQKGPPGSRKALPPRAQKAPPPATSSKTKKPNNKPRSDRT